MFPFEEENINKIEERIKDTIIKLVKKGIKRKIKNGFSKEDIEKEPALKKDKLKLQEYFLGKDDKGKDGRLGEVIKETLKVIKKQLNFSME